MKNILLISNIVISISLIVLIMMQGKGSGLGSAWGGSGEMFQTRRGLEKWILRLTIGLTILFFIVSITNLLI